MDYKEIFGEELGTQVENVINEKNINLIIDDKENPFKSQVGELTNELESLKKKAKGNDELTAAIEELQGQNESWAEKYNKSVIENEVKMAALQNKALDPADLAKFLDYDKLQLTDDGQVEGLNEQIRELKENKAYLFEADKVVANNSPANPVNVVVKKGLEEQYEEAVKSNNQPLAVALKNRMFNVK